MKSGPAERSAVDPRLLSAQPQQSQEAEHRIVKLVHDALFQRDDRIIGNGDALRADLRTAFRNIAKSDPKGFFEFLQAVGPIERVHLQGGDVDEKSRTDELVVLLVIAQDMAHVLAQETLNALAKLLHAIDVGLAHPPGPVGSVGRARLERLDSLLDPIVP